MAKRVNQAKALVKATKTSYKAPPAQKELIRRLTQKANRRIKQAFELYESAGKYRIPGALTAGKITTRDDWDTPKYPLSRKTVFDSERAYKEHLQWLKQFDVPEIKGGLPTMTEYSKIQGNKIIKAMQTAMGTRTLYDMPIELMDEMYKAILKMNSVQQTEFWKTFERQSQKLLNNYSSGQAMERALNEFFGSEEIRPILLESILESKGITSVGGKKSELEKLKHYNNKALVKYLKQSR